MSLVKSNCVGSLAPLWASSLLFIGAFASSGCVAELEDAQGEGQEAQEVGVLAVPAAPDPIRRISERCRGLNTVEWTAQSGATSYQLWRSLSSSFTSPTQIYSGSGTSHLLSVGMGAPWYLRAKACNAEGCSGYSAQVTATYFNGCQ